MLGSALLGRRNNKVCIFKIYLETIKYVLIELLLLCSIQTILKRKGFTEEELKGNLINIMAKK